MVINCIFYLDMGFLGFWGFGVVRGLFGLWGCLVGSGRALGLGLQGLSVILQPITQF